MKGEAMRDATLNAKYDMKNKMSKEANKRYSTALWMSQRQRT